MSRVFSSLSDIYFSFLLTRLITKAAIDSPALTADSAHAIISSVSLAFFCFLFIFEHFSLYNYSMYRFECFYIKDPPESTAGLPLCNFASLLHQFCQQHNLIHVAFHLDLALSDSNLRNQLAGKHLLQIRH